MAYPLAFPAIDTPLSVRVRHEVAAARFENEFTFQSQAQLHQGERYLIDVTMQPMARAQAELMAPFFVALKGTWGTFQFDLTPHCPGVTPAPGVRIFRLAAADPGWDSQLATEFDFAFSAVEEPA